MRRIKRLGGSGGVWRSSYIVLGLPSRWFGRLGIARDPRRLPGFGRPRLRRLREFDWSWFFSQWRESHRFSLLSASGPGGETDPHLEDHAGNSTSRVAPTDSAYQRASNVPRISRTW